MVPVTNTDLACFPLLESELCQWQEAEQETGVRKSGGSLKKNKGREKNERRKGLMNRRSGIVQDLACQHLTGLGMQAGRVIVLFFKKSLKCLSCLVTILLLYSELDGTRTAFEHASLAHCELMNGAVRNRDWLDV